MDYASEDAHFLFEAISTVEERLEEISFDEESEFDDEGETEKAHPFDSIRLESLKCLAEFGINVCFMRKKASEWSSDKNFLEAVKTAKNVKSTSIFTEQLVGRISRLHNSSLTRDKDNLEPLVFSALSYREE